MGETIEELQMKIELMKLEERKGANDIQKAKLAERITIRENKEEVAAKKVQDKIELKSAKEAADDGFLQMITDFQKQNPVYYDESKSYWSWDWSSRSYILVDDTAIMVKLTQLMGVEIINGSDKFKFLEGVRQKGRLHAPKDLPPTFIQFKDKVIDIETCNDFIATPEYFFTSPIPHNLGDSTATPTIDKLFSEWVHKDYILTLYEIMAYCMYKKYPIGKEFFLIGNGRNGKSQLIKMLIQFIGEDNTVGTDLNDIANSRFEAVRLFKKSVAFVAETDTNIITKTSTLKALTGEDPIKGEGKGKDPFSFINHAKLIIATNELPETKDKSDGFYRRSMIIDFPNKFRDTGKSIIDTIPEKEYENLGRKLIPILNNLLKRGSFTNDGSIESKKRRFEGKSNPISEFINQSYIMDVNGKIPMSDFQTNFNVWRASRQIPAISNKKIFGAVRDATFEIKQATEGGIKVQYILGLGYKPIKEDEFGLDEYEKQFKPNDGW